MCCWLCSSEAQDKNSLNRTKLLYLSTCVRACVRVSSACVDSAALFQMVFNVVYPMAPDQRRHVSINSARWLPDPGMGLAYGTNKGDLVICRPVWVYITVSPWKPGVIPWLDCTACFVFSADADLFQTSGVTLMVDVNVSFPFCQNLCWDSWRVNLCL